MTEKELREKIKRNIETALNSISVHCKLWEEQYLPSNLRADIIITCKDKIELIVECKPDLESYIENWKLSKLVNLRCDSGLYYIETRFPNKNNDHLGQLLGYCSLLKDFNKWWLSNKHEKKQFIISDKLGCILTDDNLWVIFFIYKPIKEISRKDICIFYCKNDKLKLNFLKSLLTGILKNSL